MRRTSTTLIRSGTRTRETLPCGAPPVALPSQRTIVPAAGHHPRRVALARGCQMVPFGYPAPGVMLRLAEVSSQCSRQPLSFWAMVVVAVAKMGAEEGVPPRTTRQQVGGKVLPHQVPCGHRCSSSTSPVPPRG